jgi:hypothetical protein
MLQFIFWSEPLANATRHVRPYSLDPTPVMCDNESACSILDKPVANDRSRYAAVNAHYVRERVYLGEVQIVSARTAEMLADCMTKR